MAKIVKKWRKVVSGCANRKSRESLIENDYLGPSVVTDYEFEFQQHDQLEQHGFESNMHAFSCDLKNSKIPIFNEYDNLEHKTLQKKSRFSRGQLKESTNTAYSRGIRRFFNGKVYVEKNNLIENSEKNVSYNEFTFKSKLFNKKQKNDENLEPNENNRVEKLNSSDAYYYEISDISNLLCDNQPLIEIEDSAEITSHAKKQKISDSKINLYENDADPNNYTRHDIENILDHENLTETKPLSEFKSQYEATHWYLNLLHDRMTKCLKEEKNLNMNDINKRLQITCAHLLYARNLYEMRVNNCIDIKRDLEHQHPCLIALACLLDSDAVRIVESHTCSCDQYIYMFSTRVKFCSWKTKLFIILKKPKRSSIDRLNFIQDLMNCRKIIKNED